MTNDLVIPQLGGKPNGKHYPFKKKGKKSVPTSSANGGNSTAAEKETIMSDERTAETPVDSAINLFEQLDNIGTVELGTPPAQPEVPPLLPPPEVKKDEPPKTEVKRTPDTTLVRILMWKRPHESAGEQNFVSWLHKEIKQRGGEIQVSKGGNIIVVMPYPKKKGSADRQARRTVLFSCHTDTVHHDCNGDQTVYYDAGLEHLFLDHKNDKSSGSCLGADDGAGIWLCLEMIKAKVPGTYVFHRGEERGGIGSNMLMQSDPTFLKMYEIALAFDRKGTDDVIITQGGQECASNKFGAALALALNDGTGFTYKISHNGSFTDTKVYRSIIPECANISVGYENAHSQDESLDYAHLEKLRDRLIALDWDSLPIDRDEKKSSYTNPSRHYNGGNYAGYQGYKGKSYQDSILPDDEQAADEHFKNHGKGGGATVTTLPRVPERRLVQLARSSMEPELLDEFRAMSLDEIRELSADEEVSHSIIVALYTELEAAYSKITAFRGLAGLD